jgi:preprotein translocase subunit SecY
MQLLDAVRNSIRLPDLRQKLLYTIFVLLIYQFATHIPVPGVSASALAGLATNTAGAGFIQVLNLLSGGAVTSFSVLANGVYPYITAQIIIQLLGGVIPALERIQKEPGGQEKINQYTYYLAIPMGLLQSVGQINIMQSFASQAIIPGYGSEFLITVQVLATMTAGTMFAIWMGDLITEEGIGNGISMVIFAGIVAQVPRSFGILLSDPEWWLYNVIAFAVLTVVTVVAIIIIQEGTRRIPVQYGKRVRGRKQYGGGSTHIPLKVNAVGMIPLIFAQAIITFPAVIAGIFFPNTPFGNTLRDMFGTQGVWYWVFEFILVVAFTYFYTDVMIQQQNLAENLQRQGGFIPGIRPGKRTQEYITRVTRRITFVGAFFLGVAAILPAIMIIIGYFLTGSVAGASRGANPATVIGSAGLIIVVGVVVDTMRQLEAQLVMRNYEGFMR